MRTTDDYKDYLNIHEFFEIFWDKIPEDLISNKYLDKNDEFIKEITFNLYEEYLRDRLTLNLAATVTTEFFRSLFKFKPGVNNITDKF